MNNNCMITFAYLLISFFKAYNDEKIIAY